MIMAEKEKLIKLYEDASYSILDKIRDSGDSLNQRSKLDLLNSVGNIISALQGDSVSLVLAIIEKAYKAGSKEALESMVTRGTDKLEASFKSGIHREAVQKIVDDAFYTVLQASDYMEQDVKNRLEAIISTANRNSLVEGMSRKAATQKAVEEATQSGITGIITKNGSQVPVDKYLSSSISYYQRKAHVDGSINRMMENGQDLLYVNSVGITCPMCAQYQGRVYSISGKDKRFPPLDVRPPYHGHCVHSTSPWNEDYQTSDDIKKMLKDSNRPFEDNRTEENIEKYKKIQHKTSKKNAARKQWIQYKSRMPDLPDLKTFASQKAKNSEKYKEWAGDYKTFGKQIGKVPKVKPTKIRKEERLFGGFTKTEIALSNKKNIEFLEKALVEIDMPQHYNIKAQVLLSHYKKGIYNEVNTRLSYVPNMGVVKEDLSIKVVDPKLEELAAKKEKAAKAKARRDARKNKKEIKEIDLTQYKYIEKGDINIKKSESTIEKLNDVEKDAIVKYTGADYGEMNGFLRTGVVDFNEANVRSQTKILTEVLTKKAPELEDNIIFTRRVGESAANYMFDEETAKMVDMAIQINKSNDTVHEDIMGPIRKKLINGKVGDQGFMSTSRDTEVFMKSGFELQLHLPKGYNKGLFVESISEFGSEAEYLLAPGQYFKIMEIEMSQGNRNSRMILKVVPDI